MEENQQVDIRGTEEWEQLRSEIYIRDRGVCWVCNTFVLLKEYDLGHLIDYCMGGKATYDNLAVMHSHCNDIKPHHSSLEEAMKWKLTPRTLICPKPISNGQYLQPNPIDEVVTSCIAESPTTYASKAYNIIQYFKNNPDLLIDKNKKSRSKASQYISHQYNIPIWGIRKILLDAGLVEKQIPIVPNPTQYFDIYNHLQDYVDKYNSLTCNNWDKPKSIGLTSYGCLIMFYLAGHSELCNEYDVIPIAKQVKLLNLPIQNLAINAQLRNKRKTINTQTKLI